MVSTSDTGKSLAALSLDLWCSSLARKGWGVHWQVPIYLLAMFVDFCEALIAGSIHLLAMSVGYCEGLVGL